MATFLHLLKRDSADMAAPVIEANRREPDARVTVVLLDGAAAPPLPAEVTVRRLADGDLDYAFFSNSGSEAVDTALKIALAYHKARGEGARTRFIGRERGYHGIGFGGISVGGIVANRKQFGNMLIGVDHLQATYNRAEQAFTKGEPEWGGHLADELPGAEPCDLLAVPLDRDLAGEDQVGLVGRGLLDHQRPVLRDGDVAGRLGHHRDLVVAEVLEPVHPRQLLDPGVLVRLLAHAGLLLLPASGRRRSLSLLAILAVR